MDLWMVGWEETQCLQGLVLLAMSGIAGVLELSPANRGDDWNILLNPCLCDKKTYWIDAYYEETISL